METRSRSMSREKGDETMETQETNKEQDKESNMLEILLAAMKNNSEEMKQEINNKLEDMKREINNKLEDMKQEIKENSQEIKENSQEIKNMKQEMKEISQEMKDMKQELKDDLAYMKQEMKEDVEKAENRMDEKLCAIHGKVMTEINLIDKKWEKGIEDTSTKCNEKLEITERTIRKEIKEKLDQTHSRMRQIIEIQNEKFEEQDEKFKKILNKENITSPGVINIGENKLNFNGNIKRQHPIPFIKYLENKEDLFLSFTTFKEFIRNLLSEEALLWFTNKETELDTFEDFKMKFLKYFWGEPRKKYIKTELFNGKFNPMKGTSYHKYAMQVYSAAQYLNSNFTEEYIVSLIIQHFEKDLEDVLLLYDFKEMDKLCQFLISQEYRLKRNNQNRYNSNNYSNGEQNGNNHQTRRTYQNDNHNNYQNRTPNQDNGNNWRQNRNELQRGHSTASF